MTVTATEGSVKGSQSVQINGNLVLQSIAVSIPSSLAGTLPVGLTAQAKAVGTYSDGVKTTTQDVTSTVTWGTSSGAVATVSNASGSQGLISGVAAGSATITASMVNSAGATISSTPGITLTVTACPFSTALAITGNNSMAAGTATQLAAAAVYQTTGTACTGSTAPAVGAAYDVTTLASWTSSNAAVATVGTSTGLVTAASKPPSPYTTNIQAFYSSSQGTLGITVNPACIQSITVNPATQTLPPGVNSQLSATGTFSDGSTSDVTSSVSFAAVQNTALSVTSGGLITSSATGGPVTITATVNAGVSFCGAAPPAATASVTVDNATLQTITIAPSSATVTLGSSQTFSATGHYSDGSNFDVTGLASWSSSNSSVLSCAANVCTASLTNSGSVIVSAAYGSQTGSASVDVNGKTLTSLAIAADSSFACAMTDSGGKPVYPIGVQIPLVVTGTYSDNSTATLTGATWSVSSGPGTISTAGVVTTTSDSSETAVVVKATEGSVSNTLSLTVSPGALATINLAPASGWAIAAGTQLQFTATGSYNGLQGSCWINNVVSWTSTNMSSVTAGSSTSGGGLATASSTAGPATVTATLGAVTATANGQVSTACITGLQLSNSALSLSAGTSVGVTLTETLSDGTSQSVPDSSATWKMFLSGGTQLDPNGGNQFSAGYATVASGVISGWNATPSGNPDVVSAQITQGTFCAGATSATATGNVTVTAPVWGYLYVYCNADYYNDPTCATQSYSEPVGITEPCSFYFCTDSSCVEQSNVQPASSGSWSVGNPSVATVDAKGNWTAAGPGSTGIKVQSGGLTGTVTVNVNSYSPTGIAVTSPGNAGARIPAGFSQQFDAQATFTDGCGIVFNYDTTATSNWISSSTATMTIGNGAPNQGLGSAVAAGTTTISAALDGISGTESFTVDSATLSSVAVTDGLGQAAGMLALGESGQLTATGTFTDGYGANVSGSMVWASSNTAVATVETGGTAPGKVTTVGAGTATVTATSSGGKVGSYSLTVSSKCLQSIAVTASPAALTGSAGLPVGVPVTWTAVATYSDGSTADITSGASWSSNNTGVVTSPAGTPVTSRTAGVGPATISASAAAGTCGGGNITGSVTATVNAATLSSLTAQPLSGTAQVAVGTNIQYQALGTYSDGSSYDITTTATWATGNQAVATVGSATGLVSGIAVGATNVTATQGNFSGQGALTVTGATLTDIQVQAMGNQEVNGVCPEVGLGSWVTGTLALPAGGYTGQLRAWGTYSDGTHQDVTSQATFNVVSGTAVTVSNATGSVGVLTSGAAGSATVSATVGSVSSSSGNVLAVTVDGTALGALSITQGSPVSVALGTTAGLTLAGTYGSQTYCVTGDATWTSAKTSIATVSKQGVVNTVATGSALVTAAIGSISSTVQVNVTSATLQSISIGPASVSLAVGATAQMTATGHYSDGSTQNLTNQSGIAWSSTSVANATVSSTGLVSAVKAGAASIGATYNNVSSSGANDCAVTVQ